MIIDSLKLFWNHFLDPSFKDVELFDREIKKGEFIVINWLLMMVKTFYIIFFTYLGAKAPEFLTELSGAKAPVMLESFNVSLQKISIFITLLEVVIFPIAFYFLYKLWVMMLIFFAEVFEYEKDDLKKACRQVIKRSYSANFLFLLPFVGGGLSVLLQGLYLYLGMKGRLNFTNLQALLVLMVPLVILGCLAILLISYLFFIFSLFFGS